MRKKLRRAILWLVKKAARGELDEAVAELRAAAVERISGVIATVAGWLAFIAAWCYGVVWLLEGLMEAVKKAQ